MGSKCLNMKPEAALQLIQIAAAHMLPSVQIPLCSPVIPRDALVASCLPSTI